MSEVIGDTRVLINELDQFDLVTKEEWLARGDHRPAFQEPADYVLVHKDILRELHKAHKTLQALQALKAAQASKSA